MGHNTNLTDNDALGIPGLGNPPSFKLEKTIDCSVTGLTSADSYSVFKVEAGWILTGMKCEIITAEGGTATADIGLTGDDTDGIWDGGDSSANALDLNAAAGTFTVAGGDVLAAAIAAQGGLLFTADDTIDLLANNTMDTAVFKLTAYFLK